MISYRFKKELKMPYKEAVEKVTEFQRRNVSASLGRSIARTRGRSSWTSTIIIIGSSDFFVQRNRDKCL